MKNRGSIILSPETKLLIHASIAGVDSNIFYQWPLSFVEETSLIRRNGQKLSLFDRYALHINYRTFRLLKDNNIIVVGLPTHTSHVLQPLHLGFLYSQRGVQVST